MAKKIVNIDGLSNAATVYDQALRVLPYFVLNEAAKRLLLNIQEVDGEHVITNKRRKGGILKPYSQGLTLGQQSELMKFFEAKLKPELTYAEENDNITNYRDKKMISYQGKLADNQAKKHPLEFMILKDIVVAVGEDIALNLFFAERDEKILSPATAFNGFGMKFDTLIAAGEISEANKNLIKTGAFAMPVDNNDSKAYDELVKFIKQGNPFLLTGEVLLYHAQSIMDKALAAYKNKIKAHTYPTYDDMFQSLRADTRCPGLKFLTDPILGTGDRLQLQKAGLLDIGVNNNADDKFVQVRSIDKDPNVVQYWVQTAIDTRISDIHPKVFMMNDQANSTAAALAGDYQ